MIRALCGIFDFRRVVESYDCILIDEFQDINKLQNDVLSNFYNSKIHFTFVGDDDQTIYTWRGADNSIIKSMVGDASVNTVYLTTNYRNNPYIVKDKICSKAKEIAVVQEKADVKEESYHEAEDDSIESNTLFEEWQNLEKEVQIKKESLEAYKKKLDEFQKKIPEMLAFNEICNEAKGFLADVRKYRDYQTRQIAEQL